MTRDINKLVPELQEKCREFIKKCKEAGIEVVITSTYRTRAEQDALYLQGRADLKTVNQVRKNAGLPPITEKENKIVTMAKDSPHCHGKAFDFVPIVNGKPAWNDTKLFTKCGKIGESLGLEWGGSWKTFKDMPHLQLKD